MSSAPVAPSHNGANSARSVWWEGGLTDGRLMMVDQRDLPHRFDIAAHTTVSDVAKSIKTMLVRGAPAIGAAGGYAMAIAAIHSKSSTVEELIAELRAAKKELDDARPTAVNLSWATNRLLELALFLQTHELPKEKFAPTLLQEANELADDDVRINKTLAKHGAALVPQNANILHHCNTGKLATVDYGTALGVIYECHAQKKDIHVWVDETRPRLQGSKLTAWELMRENIPMHLIADNAAGLLMYSNKVDFIVFGADRVAANGDTANKIGTYKIAVCGRENGIPVYACVPTSTIDLSTASGKFIEIEERNPEEVTVIGSTSIAPVNCPVYNPAFDVTPHKYLTGIITEEGVAYPPFAETLKKMKLQAEQRTKLAWENRLKHYLNQTA